MSTLKILPTIILILSFIFVDLSSAYCHNHQDSEDDMSLLPSLIITEDLNSKEFDSIIVVSADASKVANESLKKSLESYISIDKSGSSGVFVIPTSLSAGKIIFSGTGKLENDFDDVRSFAKAAKAGLSKALETGSKAPLLYVHETKFPEAGLVGLLGALEGLYVPLEVREQVPEKAVKAKKLGYYGNKAKIGSKINLAKALEQGRLVSRDIGGSDPERMAAPRYDFCNIT